MSRKAPKPLSSCSLAVLRKLQATILVAGILTAAAGMILSCNILVLSRVSWPIIGLVLCTTAILQFFAACQFKQYTRMPGWSIAVAFYMVFGLLALISPTPQLAVLALFFFCAVIGTGLMRAYCGYLFGAARGCHWLIAGGMTTIGVGIFLALQWPHGDLALSGLLLALDLTLYGVSMVGFSLHLGEFSNELERAPPRRRE